jgi:replicative DNA helicase Mcm
MERYVDEETIYQYWLDYFALRDLSSKIRFIADNYPEARSIEIDFRDVFQANGELAEVILDRPDMVVRVGEAAINSLLEPDQKVGINLRIRNLFKNEKISIRDLRAENLSKFISLEGIVRKVTEVRPKLLVGVFSCTSCGFKQDIDQDPFHYTEPLECPKDDGGCGKRAGSTTFKFQITESLFIDSQKIEIQEFPEGLRGGDQPQRIAIILEDDLCGEVSPGDRISITGSLKAKQRKEGQTKATVFDIYLHGNCIDSNDQVYDDMELTEEDINHAKMMAKDPQIFSKIIGSIAPSIFGMDHIKESLALQLFGGVAKEYPDGSRGRGDIHLLLVGDPGTAKSQLLTYMSNLAPRGIFTSGKSASAAGLTAAVVKDEFGEGRYTLEAGVMVLSDMGLACIDEMDKMTESDRSAMHEAMEQQTVSIAKAGIQSTLQSRCSVLGAANPKQGRFRVGQPKHEQINLPPPLRSRFDLIFTITDEPRVNEDRKLASSVLERHWLGELKMSETTGDTRLRTLEETGSNIVDRAKPIFAPEVLRRYVAYAKRECYPVLSDEAREEIIDFYVNLRAENSSFGGEGGGSVALTARQLEALVRMAEASARIKLSSTVTRQDARVAIDLMRYSLKDIALTESGTYDIDGVLGSGFKSQKDKMYEIVKIIKEFQTKDGKMARKDLVAVASDINIDEHELDGYLKKLQDEGAIFEPRSGEYSVL